MDMAENSLIEKLQRGDKVLCKKCSQGFYTTPVDDVSHSREFICEKCHSIVRVSPNIVVE